MGKRKLQYDVVPESAYTDFSDRYEKEKSSPSNRALLGAGIAATASLSTYAITKIINTTSTTIPTTTTTTVIPPITTPIIESVAEPLNVLSQFPSSIPVYSPEIIQTGLIADTSLNMIANILDPVIQILVAFSLPIASLIIVGSFFMLMMSQSEKALSWIMNAGLGYVLIQLSPLFLMVLRQIGKAI